MILDDPLHVPAVGELVGLGARSANGGPLARVQGPELDPGRIDGTGHFATQRVDLLHQVTLADASYRGIAGHLADLVEVLGEQERLSPHPRRGESGLDAGMATTDDDDLRLFHVEHLVLDHFPMQNRSKIRSSTSSVVA